MARKSSSTKFNKYTRAAQKGLSILIGTSKKPVFDCPLCARSGSVSVKIVSKKGARVGRVECGGCREGWEEGVGAIDEAVDVYTAWTDKIGYTKEAKDMKPKARRGFGPGAPSKSALAIKSEAFAEAEKKTLARKAKKAAAEEFKDGGYEMGEQGVM